MAVKHEMGGSGPLKHPRQRAQYLHSAGLRECPEVNPANQRFIIPRERLDQSACAGALRYDYDPALHRCQDRGLRGHSVIRDARETVGVLRVEVREKMLDERNVVGRGAPDVQLLTGFAASSLIRNQRPPITSGARVAHAFGMSLSMN